jgi:hypothetical protein
MARRGSHGLKAVIVASSLLAPITALAGNDEGIPVGDEAALTGNTVAAMVSDGSSLFYNPAGLAGAERDQVDVAATVTMLRVHRLPAFVETTSGASGDGNFTEFDSVPSALSYVRSLGPKLRLGIGLFVPEQSLWSIDVPLSSGGNTFYLSTTNQHALYYAMAGLGFRVNRRLRLGTSLSGLYLSRLANASAGAEYVQADGSVQIFGLSQHISVWAIGTTMAIGVQWEPVPELRIGAALRSPIFAIRTSLTGSQVTAGATTTPPVANLDAGPIRETHFGFYQVSAVRPRLGVAWTWDTSWVSVEGDFQPALETPKLDIARQRTWNLRTGAMLGMTDNSWLGVGAFTDRSPEEQPDGVTATRMDYYGVSAGVRLDHPHQLGPNEKADSVVFSASFALRYAYGTGEVVGVLFQQTPATPLTPAEELASNTLVPAEVHEISLYIGSTLYF